MLISKTCFIVRYAETDQMGIVHHSNYPIWFEVGRTEFIKELGMTYSQIENEGLMLPIIEVRCKYKMPAKYEDKITIITKIKEITNVRLTFTYEVLRNDDPVVIAYGETYHAWTDKQLKPVNIKKNAPAIYKFFEKISDNGGE